MAMDPRHPDDVPRRPSKITIPEKAHPFARLVFAEMKRQNVPYTLLEWRSGVLTSTFKAWRTENAPGLASIAAALGALGWDLVPVPKLDTLPADLQLKVVALATEFRSHKEVLGAAIQAAANFPDAAKRDLIRRRASEGARQIVDLAA